MIQETAQKLDLKPFYITINENISIEQWLRAFHDSKYVITDSYHGLVFSIIFNKPFLLLENEKRGNARFESILKMFNLKANSEKYDWNYINLTIKKRRLKPPFFAVISNRLFRFAHYAERVNILSVKLCFKMQVALKA